MKITDVKQNRAARRDAARRKAKETTPEPTLCVVFDCPTCGKTSFRKPQENKKPKFQTLKNIGTHTITLLRKKTKKVAEDVVKKCS